MVPLIPGLFWLFKVTTELVESEVEIVPLTWPLLVH
jgi:hypothetical protein